MDIKDLRAALLEDIGDLFAIALDDPGYYQAIADVQPPSSIQNLAAEAAAAVLAAFERGYRMNQAEEMEVPDHE